MNGKLTITPHLRIARPVSNVERAATMYCQGLGLKVIGSFVNHEGFDGVMLGVSGGDYHFEFTRHQAHPVVATPTAEDLAVFYLPSRSQWEGMCVRMLTAGFIPVNAFNPYWETNGRTFEDENGYRVVLQNARWIARDGAQTD